MCECRPDLGDFLEFQPALFKRYDLSVEFLRRRRWVRELMTARWPQLRSHPDDQIVANIVGLCQIEPLRLHVGDERLLVEPYGEVGDTGETCYFFRKFVYFTGDAELWDLYPIAGLSEEVEGSVSNFEFATGVLAVDEKSAFQELSKQVHRARLMIALQEERIRDFNRSLFPIGRRQVAKLRGEILGDWWERPIGAA